MSHPYSSQNYYGLRNNKNNYPAITNTNINNSHNYYKNPYSEFQPKPQTQSSIQK